MISKIGGRRKKLICTPNIYRKYLNIKILFFLLVHKITIEECLSRVLFISGPLVSFLDIYVLSNSIYTI